MALSKQRVTAKPQLVRPHWGTDRESASGQGLPFRLPWQHAQCTQLLADLPRLPTRQPWATNRPTEQSLPNGYDAAFHHRRQGWVAERSVGLAHCRTESDVVFGLIPYGGADVILWASPW
jgi:hypothetical protein